MSSDQDERLYLSVQQAAELLDVHPNTLRNWIQAGTIVSSRVPGSRAHRFAREEVLRLQTERGAITSSVAPALQTDRRELVTAVELDSWASSLDARHTFPELVRRLLDGTPGITNLDVPAHEGIAARGWDGTADSLGSKYLPNGRLVMEFGTNGDIKRKAQKDYDDRVKSLPDDADSIFLFATPRRWPGGAQWAAERTKERNFGQVKVVDAQVLEGWLQATTQAHYWISEHLGYRPRDAQTLEGWWANFRKRTHYPLPAEFFGAGRDEQSDALLRALADPASPQIATLQAGWQDDALAFTYQALTNHGSTLSKAVLVTHPTAWDRLTEAAAPLILIPLFSEQEKKLELPLALDRGHKVLLLASDYDVVTATNPIVLRKIDRMRAAEVLRVNLPEMPDVDPFVARARRSMAAAVRSISRDPRIIAPDWLARSDLVDVLLPLVLAQRWTPLEGDTAIVEQLTGRHLAEVETLLTSLASRPDAPFVMSGGIWRPASPMEAALLLLPKITPAVALRWKEAVLEVLLAVDPFEGMGTVERLTKSVLGTRPAYSEVLRGGLARGLALCGACDAQLMDGNSAQRYVDEIVQELLARADNDPTGASWRRLSAFLPSLAEASPEVFQDAVERDLASNKPVLGAIFNEPVDDAFFGSRSTHVGLVLALETLSWAPQYFGRVARLLGDLTRLDPGGKNHSRPIESLQKITLGWTSQSGASVDAKITVVAGLLERNPDTGWTLAMMLWPSSHGFASAPHLPEFRDWPVPHSGVLMAEWFRFVHELVALVIAAAGAHADRWAQIAPVIDQLPPTERQSVVERFDALATQNTWNDEERYAVWEVLTEELNRHEEFATAQWAMPATDIAPLRRIASRLEPAQDPRQFASLFDWRASVPGYKLGDEGYDAELKRLQHQALEQVLSMGAGALRSLTLEAKTPFLIGQLIANVPEVNDREILDWFSADESNLRQAARAYATAELSERGISWLQELLSRPELAALASRVEVMAAVAAHGEYWGQLDGLSGELIDAYWRMFNPYQVTPERRSEASRLLIEHDRPWAAVVVVSNMLKSEHQPSTDLVSEVLTAVINGEAGPEDPTMAGYYVGEILSYFEEQDPGNPDLARFEFVLFEFLHDHHPSSALYAALGNEPTDFVEMIKSLYRADGEAERTANVKEQGFAHLSYSVLNEWSSLPGQGADGTIDADHLTKWVRSARLALADAGRAAIGDEQIGQVLSASPEGIDGVWPAEPVRELIESIGNTRIDTGLHIGLMNRRGITSRGVYEGGRPERVLESRYRDMASQLSDKWPRTARVLRGIADSYQREARANDAESERWADEG